VDLDAVELRVLGCLLEKERTTPDQYPLSLNALRLATNQTTNRDPVVDYDEATIRSALDRLATRKLTRLASGPGSRVAKFRHLVPDTLDLTPSQLALLAVLMLRGPQTAAELRTRSERLYPFGSVGDVESALAGLAERDFVQRLPRRPGEREERWTQLLGETASPAVSELPRETTPLEERVAELERRLALVEERLSPPRAGMPTTMDEQDERIEDARRSRDEAEHARQEAEPPASPGEPWAKTSSGDADSVTEDG
jgi:uncharacterized protein